MDRHRFAAAVGGALEHHPLVEIRRREARRIPTGDAVIATGPLTSEAMAAELARLLGDDYLYFYDAIAPIVEADSLDLGRLFRASRYGKGGGADYLNSALDREGYLAFHRAHTAPEVLPLHDFERELFFEGCLPIEELARRGVDTLRFGPMKPVGLEPPDGSTPWAVAQLRREDLAESQYNLVGFQSRMKWGDQKRVLRMLPGLESARFVRLGQIHRNTFINSPLHLNRFYRLRRRPRTRLAGQITGVEGYLESAATGLAIGLYLALERGGPGARALPATTGLGALARHLTESSPKRFQPANINFGLLPPLARRVRRRHRRAELAARARRDLAAWAGEHRVAFRPPEIAAAAAAPA